MKYIYVKQCINCFFNQADSMFNLQCPYDVMVLLNQEKRRDLAEAIRMELLTKDTSETPDEKDTGARPIAFIVFLLASPEYFIHNFD